MAELANWYRTRGQTQGAIKCARLFARVSGLAPATDLGPGAARRTDLSDHAGLLIVSAVVVRYPDDCQHHRL
eukprot:4091371-Alexandrium_andersonii.AAC.1